MEDKCTMFCLLDIVKLLVEKPLDGIIWLHITYSSVGTRYNICIQTWYKLRIKKKYWRGLVIK
jgi:hypothetical protein